MSGQATGPRPPAGPQTPPPPPGPKALAVYRFPATGATVRTVVIDGEPWFVAADVCAVLELGNPRSSVALLDSDERGVHTMDTPGGPQPLGVVSESGLYSLILRSRKPEARPFKRWVTSEVLPAIRRTGRYELAPALPQTYVAALRELADTVEQRDAAQAALAVAAPKAEAYDTYQSADGTHSFGEVAKMLHAETGLGRNLLMRRLRELRVLMADNVPYQRYAEHFHVVAQSYEHSDGEREATHTTRVRPSGVELIRRRLARSAVPALPEE
ncbi:BRO family protein [Catellatospora sp. NPDC049609]|uniref:BRO family protein n=1 Tax=Catellatospora sp. NPDC049609 TaxID=3155505 RepID=UPI003419EC9F